jgi:transcription factor E2F3
MYISPYLVPCNFLDIISAGVEWNELDALQEDFCMAREHPTTPNHASNIGEASSASNPTVG